MGQQSGDANTVPGGVSRRAHEYAAVKDWHGYFGVVVGKPPRETLLGALAAFDQEPAPDSARLAVDFGCGEGRDTLELLRRGWRVLAIDAHPEAFEHLLPRVPEEHRARLETRVGTYEESELPACDLVNASFALPFCSAEGFAGMWSRVVEAIRPGGRFAGQLFGDRDEWTRLGDRVHHTRSEVDRLFERFVFESLREDEKDEADGGGGSGGKHWHVFHIVARKRA